MEKDLKALISEILEERGIAFLVFVLLISIGCFGGIIEPFVKGKPEGISLILGTATALLATGAGITLSRASLSEIESLDRVKWIQIAGGFTKSLYYFRFY